MPYYTYGTATDEQDLVGQLETFLTSTIGTWTKIDTVTDSASDKDLVFFSPGTEGYRDIYLRFRGYSNYVYIYGYSLWVNSSTYDGELYNSLYTRVYTNSGSMTYWFFGDVNYVWIVVKDGVDGKYFSGYGGYVDSYYSADLDDLPLAVAGCASDTYGFLAHNRLYMYSATSSGTNVLHYAYDIRTPMLQYADPSDRDGSWFNVPFIIYNSQAGHVEIRGELRGALYISGTGLNSEDWITISGTNHHYFIRRYSDSICEAYGPTISG